MFTGMILLLSSCFEPPDNFLNKDIVNTSFDYKTTAIHSLRFEFLDATGNPFSGLKLEILDRIPSSGGQVIHKVITNENGLVNQGITLPSYQDKLVLRILQIGLPELFLVESINGSFEFIYHGLITSGHQVIDEKIEDKSSGSASGGRSQNLPIVYMGTFSSRGVPDYLEKTNDAISSNILTLIDASLPEYQPVPEYHPTYLADGKKTSIELIEAADVWLTFVHEGAGWRNAIAYYTYPTGNPPTSVSDIDSVVVVFPNLSFSGSGGGLQSGNKVHLGTFPAGITIGLALLANGWDSSNKNSKNYYHIIYSNKAINPEPDEALKQHNVLVYDEENQLFLIGFEDVRRDNIPFACDHDFNDAIMYFTSNPVTAISTENINPIDQPIDSDGDGISDIYDEYPNDPLLAYSNYYPSETTYGTLTFEDNWPNLGDYDFNDLVMDYKFTYLSNAKNEVVQFQGDFKIMALGAGYRNGFGFSADLPSSRIKSVTGSSLSSGYIQVNANGTEANQSKAVFIVTDNLHDHFNVSGFVNTEKNKPYHEPQHVILNVNFTKATNYDEIGSPPYNPFLIVNQERGREVHLPSYYPTDLVDTDYFGIGDDDSNIESGIYYKSKTSLPWAINFPSSFDYPIETSDVRNAHLKFNSWTQSDGFSYMDWYINKNGYRNSNKIYIKLN